MKVTVYLVRHGETRFNVRGRIQGTSDSLLTENGIQQAKDLGSVLRDIPFTHAYASPCLRARDTAECIVTYHSLPVSIEKDLIEFDFGELEGAKMRDIPDIIEECWGKQDWTTYGGITADLFYQQIDRALHSIVEKSNDGETVLAVTHGLWMRFALHKYGSKEYLAYEAECEQRREFPIPNCAFAKLIYEDGVYHLEGFPKSSEAYRKESGKKVSFLYVRHGETRFNKIRRIQGRCDSLLTDEGKEALKETAKALKNVNYTKVYCSPFYRALETAEIITEGKKEITPVRELLEFDFGDYDGRRLEPVHDFVRSKHADMDWHKEHGENKEDVRIRLTRLLHRIYDESKDGDTVLLVAHGTLYYLLAEIFYGYTREEIKNITGMVTAPNGGIARFTCENGEMKNLELMVKARDFKA